MDNRIIDFLRSGYCDSVATVTVCRNEERGTRDEKSAAPTVNGLYGSRGCGYWLWSVSRFRMLTLCHCIFLQAEKIFYGGGGGGK